MTSAWRLPEWILQFRIATFAFPLSLAIIAALFLATAAYVILRRKSWYAFYPLFVGVLVIAMACSAWVNYQNGWKHKVNDILYPNAAPVPTIDLGDNPPTDVSRGVHVNVEIPSPKAKLGTQPGDVWLPPQYFTQADRAFPVVYLYHGTPGTSDDWFEMSDASSSAIAAAVQRHPVILVAPTCAPEDEDGECVNGTFGNWNTYLSEDVPTFVADEFRILGGAKHTATAGLSMGGYCAQMMALRFPDKFSVSGNFSGTTAADYAGGLPALFGPVPNLRATINSYDSSWLVQNRPESRTVATWLEVGTYESPTLIADQQAFYKLAKSLKMKAHMKEVPGAHTALVWDDAFEDWLNWAIPQIS